MVVPPTVSSDTKEEDPMPVTSEKPETRPVTETDEMRMETGDHAAEIPVPEPPLAASNFEKSCQKKMSCLCQVSCGVFESTFENMSVIIRRHFGSSYGTRCHAHPYHVSSVIVRQPKAG